MAAATPTPAPAPAPATIKTNGFWDNVKEFILIPFDNSIMLAPEIGHLAPVIMTLGVAFMAIVTLNYPLAIFSASTVEASLIYNLVHMLSTYIATPEGLRTDKANDRCKSSFEHLTPSRFAYFFSKGLKKDFPVSSLYYITFAASYCIQSMIFFSKECSELGPQYSNRPYLAIIGAALFIVLFSIYLLAYGCDTLTNMLFTIIIASLIGYLICYQNYILFGKSSVNLLFIPILAQRDSLDFICVSSKS